MSGLVLAMSVLLGTKHPVALSTTTVRNIRLVVQQKTKWFGKFIGMGYVTQDGRVEPASGSVPIPGPTLVLKRGQPVKITVVNYPPEPTAVHRHGIEFKSFPDGVPGWSGSPGRIMPPIGPKDSSPSSCRRARERSMTADFEYTPTTPGDLRLEIKTMLAGWIIPVQLRVR